MTRSITLDCDQCGTRLGLERAKEVLYATQEANAYHSMDLCADCLDTTLKRAESVNDAEGTRQRVAALVRLPGNEVPQRGQGASGTG
ncbi:MAG TPA: hypothetical protein VNE62_09495 [Actinomycetota bacterium]|nr:hypothetical protein [Actinomycetota bacterium]